MKLKRKPPRFRLEAANCTYSYFGVVYRLLHGQQQYCGNCYEPTSKMGWTPVCFLCGIVSCTRCANLQGQALTEAQLGHYKRIHLTDALSGSPYVVSMMPCCFDEE